MKDRDIRLLCAEWVEALGLGGWTVDVRFVSDPAAVGNGCATCEYSTTTRDAEIKILRFRYRTKDQILLKRDYEIDLVHELLHLWVARFERCKPGSDRWIRMEQFVEAMARCLVNLKRQIERLESERAA